MRRETGFTVIELMVTITVMAVLMMVAAPLVVDAIRNANASDLVHRLPQDAAWARNRSSTSPTPYRIVLGPGCQWTTEQASYAAGALAWVSTDETRAHSMPLATSAANYRGVECAFTGNAQQTVTFDSRGLITDNAPTVTITNVTGQQWKLQFLLSGLVLLNARSSS